MNVMYKDPRTCECGYTTMYRGNMSNHKKHHCRQRVDVDGEKDQLRERVASLEQQLATKDEQLATKDEQLATKDEQLSAKDEQLKELIRCAKRPRVERNTNTTNHISNSINVFGRESLSHITEAKLKELLSDPDTSVSRLVTLKHSVVENRNVRVPNVREKWVEVLRQDADGQQRWETVPKGDILGNLVMDNAMLLEGEADEETVSGARYSQWHERLLQSQDQEGRLYKDQLERVHRSLAQSTRVGGGDAAAAAGGETRAG